MTRPSSGALTASTPTCASSLRQQAYTAFQEAYGNRHLCGSCHRRSHAEDDWLCKRCRSEIVRFEVDDTRRATVRLAGEPYDFAVMHTRERDRYYRRAA